MLKGAVVSLLAFGWLAVLSPVADASPIPVSSCTVDSFGNNICNLFESDANGNVSEYSSVAPASSPDWLVGYTFVLDPDTTFASLSDEKNISDVVIIHQTFAELFSLGYQVSATQNFQTEISAALSLAPIDGITIGATTLGNGTAQIVGTPGAGFNGGAGQCNFAPACQYVGLVNEDTSGVADLTQIFDLEGFNGDEIIVNSGDLAPIVTQPVIPPPPPNGAVPEPTTLALLGTGVIGAGIRRWRSRRPA